MASPRLSGRNTSESAHKICFVVSGFAPHEYLDNESPAETQYLHRSEQSNGARCTACKFIYSRVDSLRCSGSGADTCSIRSAA